jgi:hypothetical protein
LGADLLPVVPDPAAIPAPSSKVKAFGKIPSEFDSEGRAYGLAAWQSRKILPEHVARWSSDRRLGMCVRASAVRAIDVDVTDEDLSGSIYDALSGIARCTRNRDNSAKFLIAFKLEGSYKKRIINTAHGRIEFLADGQQWVAAGTHPSGTRYTWTVAGGLPHEFPTLSPDEFEALWARLSADFSVEPQRTQSTLASTTGDATLLTELDRTTGLRLAEALMYQPLLDSAADNSVWSEIGYALLSLGQEGYNLWHDFSRRAPGYIANAPEEWWEAHVSQTPRTDYRHILNMARALGWGLARAEDFPTADAEPPTAAAPAHDPLDALSEPLERPILRLAAGQLHHYAKRAEQILSPDVYTQANALVRLGGAAELESDATRDAAQCVIIPATREYVRRRLTEKADLQRFDNRTQKWKPTDCPGPLADNIMKLGDWPHIRALDAIARAPFIRADGSICEVPGYDAASCVLYLPSEDFPAAPEAPTYDAARAALATLLAPFDEFPYGTEAAKAAFAAHILTEVTRTAVDTAPMFWYSAPSAGTGKTLLAAMASLIVHGTGAPVRPWAGDEDEMRKAIFASLLAGDRTIAFDNIPNGSKIRSSVLCSFITSGATYKDRRLGVSEVVSVRNRATCLATGNNITPVSDLARRSIVVRLDANTAALRSRTFEIANIKEYVRQHRAQLLLAALTMVRAHHLAGWRGPTPLPSFEDWSRLVRNALLWLGMADPVETQEDEADDETENDEAVFGLLANSPVLAGRDFTAADIVVACADLADTDGLLQTAMRASGCADVTDAARVGYWLRDKRDKVSGLYKLERCKLSRGHYKWRLRSLRPDSKDLE